MGPVEQTSLRLSNKRQGLRCRSMHLQLAEHRFNLVLLLLHHTKRLNKTGAKQSLLYSIVQLCSVGIMKCEQVGPLARSRGTIGIHLILLPKGAWVNHELCVSHA